jgi:hypothetical protein
MVHAACCCRTRSSQAGGARCWRLLIPSQPFPASPWQLLLAPLAHCSVHTIMQLKRVLSCLHGLPAGAACCYIRQPLPLLLPLLLLLLLLRLEGASAARREGLPIRVHSRVLPPCRGCSSRLALLWPARVLVRLLHLLPAHAGRAV